jgi:hypothetical protein
MPAVAVGELVFRAVRHRGEDVDLRPELDEVPGPGYRLFDLPVSLFQPQYQYAKYLLKQDYSGLDKRP